MSTTYEIKVCAADYEAYDAGACRAVMTDFPVERHDRFRIRETSPSGGFTGRAMEGIVMHVMTGLERGIPRGFAVASISPHRAGGPPEVRHVSSGGYRR